jgi:D-tyrosyl-tRNA(Tyr) deacylase
MRCVVQRVTGATLRVVEEGVERSHARIGPGLCVMVGIERGDTETDLAWAASKIAHLRIFEDEQGKMNRSVLDTGGGVLLVPNFTVAGDARKGRRPSFDNAMRPPEASAMFDALCAAVAGEGVPVQAGVFGADMRVELVNDGPITIWLDSRG